MKLFCFTIYILGLNMYVEGAEFRFGDTGKDPCILLNMDATFNLTTTDNNITEMTPLFDLEGAIVTSNKSLCGTADFSAVLTVIIFPSKERLTFKFVLNNINVEMAVVLDVTPEKHFDDQNTTMQFEMEGDSNLNIGALSTSSFRCVTEQTMIFNRDEPYYMTMSITNLQVQAYNIEGNTFGPAVECAQDPGSTQEPTTQPVPETTPLPDVPIYVLRQDNEACIVLKGRLKFTIKYQKNSGDTGEVTVSMPENVQVNGSCRSDNTSQVQNIRLTFFETDWFLDIEIGRLSDSLIGLDDETEYGWQKIRLSFDMDDHFDDAVTRGQRKTVETEQIANNFKASTAGSYKCNSEQDMNLPEEVTLVVSDLQYYAFSETSDTAFPDTGVTECDADKDDDDDEERVLVTVLGSVFGGLAVVIFTIGFIWKIKSRKRVNYEVLAGVSYDRSLRSDTSMEKRMY